MTPPQEHNTPMALTRFKGAHVVDDPFTLDVAAASHNTKCANYYTIEQNGLTQNWGGQRVWCNPPFSELAPWIRKAWECWHTTTGITMLLPANRTEQQFWQLMVEPHRDRAGSPLTTEFLPGRLRFLKPGQTAVGPHQRPPFGCVLLTWHVDAYNPDHITGGLFGSDQ